MVDLDYKSKSSLGYTHNPSQIAPVAGQIATKLIRFKKNSSDTFLFLNELIMATGRTLI